MLKENKRYDLCTILLNEPISNLKKIKQDKKNTFKYGTLLIFLAAYKDLVEKFVKVCGGLPLSLQVIGAHVYGRTDRHYWRSVLKKVLKTLPEDIKRRVKISFDSLNSEQKQIFKDIACFFIGKPLCMARRIWEGSGWSAEFAIQTLKDKCLIEIVWCYSKEFDDNKLCFRMHDHLRDLGRELADELGPLRLWHPKHFKRLVCFFVAICGINKLKCFSVLFSYLIYFL